MEICVKHPTFHRCTSSTRVAQLCFIEAMSLPPQQVSWFENSRNITFEGKASLITVGGDYYLHEPFQPLNPNSLRSQAARETMFGTEAFTIVAPPCLPDTRVQVLAEIKDWVIENDPSKPMLWLTGPAGFGKTCVMSSAADMCNRGGFLASSFFAMGLPEGKKPNEYFAATLAWQLFKHESLRHLLQDVLMFIDHSDPGIFHRELESQMEALILKPLRSMPPGPDVKLPSIIVIDGFEEWDAKEHTWVLEALLKACTDPAFPFRFLISSRPDYNISKFFSTTAGDLSVQIVLDDKYNPDADIALYYKERFRELRADLGGLPEDWPGEDVINNLVTMTAGHWSFARSVTWSIKNSGVYAEKQLDVVLGHHPLDETESPFTFVDGLYLAILNRCPKPDLAVQWLLAITSDPLTSLPRMFVNQLMESRPGEALFLFKDLASVIYVPRLAGDPDAKRYKLYNHTFIDYLADPVRNKTYFVEATTVKKFLLDRYLFVLKNKGPEIPISPTEQQSFLDLFVPLISKFEAWTAEISRTRTYRHDVYLSCDAKWWVQVISEKVGHDTSAVEAIFNHLHRECRGWPKSDTPACKLWKLAITEKYPSLNLKQASKQTRGD